MIFVFLIPTAKNHAISFLEPNNTRKLYTIAFYNPENLFDTLDDPMEKLLTPERGSDNYRSSWALYDQIMISHNFLNYESP